MEFLDHPDGLVEYGVALRRDIAAAIRRHPEALVDADLDTLATALYVKIDDLLRMEAVRRSDLAGWAEYGYCASHSRYFWDYVCTCSPPCTACPWASR